MGYGETGTIDKGVDVVENEAKKPTSVFVKMKDKTYRRQMMHWMRLPIGFFTIVSRTRLF